MEIFSSSVLLHRVCQGCEIEISGHKLTFYFIHVDVSTFDMILGMDWLLANCATIDYFKRRVGACRMTGRRVSLIYLCSFHHKGESTFLFCHLG